MSGLLDGIDEDKAADQVMQELGYEKDETPIPEDTVVSHFVGEIPTEETLEQISVHFPGESYPEEESTELDQEFLSAERRLLKATLYRQLIKGRFFDGDEELVLEVEAELKEFVKKQYLISSGAASPPQAEIITRVVEEKVFSPEEITALKGLANRIIKNPKLIETKPVVKPAQTAPKPISKPIAYVPPASPQKPAVAPAKKPTLRARRVPEEVQSKPIPKPQQKQKTTQQVNNVVASSVPSNDSVIEENGSRFRIKYVEMPNIDEYGVIEGAKIRNLQSGRTCVLSNGIQVYKDGTVCQKIIKTLLTNNQQMPGRVPFPSIQEMERITESQSTLAASRQPTVEGILGLRR